MKLATTPANTYVVLVGIEQYGHGIPSLVGPAVDALSICCWMLNKGVPHSNIQLLINEAVSDKPAVLAERTLLRQRVTAAGVTCQLPYQHEIEKAMSGATLERLRAARGSALWVYWSGHGILTHATRERMVLTGDATDADYFGVDLENTANRLRLDRRLLPFTHQLLIVDACGTWTMPATPIRCQYEEVSGKKNQNVLQTRIFAAPEGCTARIAAGELTSDFTRQLLRCLVHQEPWSVDVEELRIALRTGDTATVNPFVVQLEDSDGNTYGHRSDEPVPRAATLATIVHGSAAFPVDTLYRLFRTITTCASDQCPRSSRDVVMRLDDYSLDGSGLTNSERFALSLELRCTLLLGDLDIHNRAQLLELRDALHCWNLDTDQPLLTRATVALQSQLAEPRRVFIDLGGEETRAWIWRDAAWQPVQRRPNAGESFLARIKTIIADVVNENVGLRGCHIELALDLESVATAPLGENISGSSRPMRLGMEVPVTLRIRDRWSRGEPMTNWIASWNGCRRNLEANGQLVWLDRAIPGGGMGIADDQCMSLDLGDAQHVQWLQEHLEDGALWGLACAPAASAAFRNTLDDRVSLGALRDWMRTARDIARLSITPPVNILLVADPPIGLPDGVTEPLNLPH